MSTSSDFRDLTRSPTLSGTGEAALVPRAEVVPTSTLLATGEASRMAPNILSIGHWERLLGGELYAPLSRLDAVIHAVRGLAGVELLVQGRPKASYTKLCSHWPTW